MEIIKIQNVTNNNIVKEVKKELLNDYLRTKNWALFTEKEEEIAKEIVIKENKKDKKKNVKDI